MRLVGSHSRLTPPHSRVTDRFHTHSVLFLGSAALPHRCYGLWRSGGAWAGVFASRRKGRPRCPGLAEQPCRTRSIQTSVSRWRLSSRRFRSTLRIMAVSIYCITFGRNVISSALIFTYFERWIFKIGILRRSKIFTPIDSPHRELQIRFLSVKNGFELIVLRSDEVDDFFRPLSLFFKKCNTLYCNAHYKA